MVNFCQSLLNTEPLLDFYVLVSVILVPRRDVTVLQLILSLDIQVGLHNRLFSLLGR